MTIVAVIWVINYNKAFVINVEREVVVSEEKSSNKSKGSGLFSKAILPLLLVLCLCAIIDNLVKDGLNTWVPSILKEKFKLDDSLSIILTLVLPILGFFGGSCNPYLEKKLKSFVPLLGFWFLLTAIFTLIVILFLDISWVVVLLSFGLISLFTHGANGVITGMAPLYMRDKIGNSGMLAGVLNGCCYVGSTISSYCLGAIADNFTWNGVFILLLVVSCIPILVTGAMTIVKIIRNKKTVKNS
jgi:OPA family glycerol-3-phosphate transporter-like MFS transporter